MFSDTSFSPDKRCNSYYQLFITRISITAQYKNSKLQRGFGVLCSLD